MPVREPRRVTLRALVDVVQQCYVLQCRPLAVNIRCVYNIRDSEKYPIGT
jgi:hypothetical protein